MPIQIQKIQKLLPLIIAVACGVLSILLLNVYLQKREGQIWAKIKQIQEQQPPPPPRMGVVLLAKRDIPARTPITLEDLLIKETPVEYIQPGAVTSLDRVVGQIASSPIAAGEQMIITKLLPPPKVGKTIAELTPGGKRAITVAVDNFASIANLVHPGDYVDVHVLIKPPSGTAEATAEGTAPRLVPLFQGVKVLAVEGEFITKKPEERKISGAAGTVTLALTPQEAILLSFVQDQGAKIKLVQRSLEDTKVESVKPADWETFFEYLRSKEAMKPKLKEQPPEAVGPTEYIEIYRGQSKEKILLSK